MTKATGDDSHSEGMNTEATGQAAHAEGSSTRAQGNSSHVEGNRTKALEESCHAEGYGTNAAIRFSHAEGYMTKAAGAISHAEGENTETHGHCTHAEGKGTKAVSACQHVQGKYNKADSEDKYAHIVGGGDSDNNRRNIHTLDWEGNAYYEGDVTNGNGVSLNSLKAELEELRDLCESGNQQGGSAGTLQLSADQTVAVPFKFVNKDSVTEEEIEWNQES